MSFQLHRIELDPRGHYDLPLAAEFPFSIKLFRFLHRQYTFGLTWHERLELFLPLDGPVRIRMGDAVVALRAGDLLVVDNLNLHSVLDDPGLNSRVVVVSFLPEFVYSLGSPSHDYTFLLPFYNRLTPPGQVLRAEDLLAPPVAESLAQLVSRFFGSADRRYHQAGCKAAFLELLYHLACHFRSADVLRSEFLRQQERTERLKRALDHLSQHYADRITVAEAAALTHMSAPHFMKLFKKAAGMTFVAYVSHLRLSHAVRMLRETTQSIADIATRVGFSDQSYFDRRFKRAFGMSPRDYRSQQGAAGPGRQA